MDSVRATISADNLSDVLQRMRERAIETTGCLPV
jgi:hypothetical protein